MKNDCDGCPETDGCEDIGRNMMVMVLLLFSTVVIIASRVRHETWCGED